MADAEEKKHEEPAVVAAAEEPKARRSPFAMASRCRASGAAPPLGEAHVEGLRSARAAARRARVKHQPDQAFRACGAGGGSEARCERVSRGLLVLITPLE